MRRILPVLLAILFSPPVAAAPMWLERQAAPKAELIDPAFAVSDEASAIGVDHRAWADFLASYVVAGDDSANGAARVRYAAVAAADRESLGRYIASLEAVDPATLNRAGQMAFWINLYNAATLRLILDHPGVTSIRDIAKPWDAPVATVLGRALTLNDIEHGIIRPVFRDARAHYAVNCASLGCPDLAREPYAGAAIEAQLDAAARGYVNHPRGVAVKDGRVAASKIYGWYARDFGGGDAAILDHMRRYADPSLAGSLADARKISRYHYDWALNGAP